MAHARWFASLPADELLPIEHQLRKVLIKAINNSPGPFPLIEWIDRRVGGEIETRRDAAGNFEILMRGGASPPSDHGGGVPDMPKEAFFSSLSPDTFAPPEEALREAIFEFLAAWRSQELATLRDLSSYPSVVRCRTNFLPRSVPLRDWIEHRIGGEVEFRGMRGGSEIVHLTDAAKGTVMAKYQQMQMATAPPMGQIVGGHPMVAGAGAMGFDKNAWFASLPPDELLPGELALREAILSWLATSQRSPVRPGAAPHLSDAGMDPRVRDARQAFLPKLVKLADWIERRIGGEVELRLVGNGQHEVYLRGSAPPLQEASPRGRDDRGARAQQASQEEKDRFFESLPADEFAPAEEGLREGLLGYLDRFQGPGPAMLNDAAQEEDVQRWRREVLPKGCPVRLSEWIDRRIGGEIETRLEPNGKIVFGLRGTLPPMDNGSQKRRRM